MAEPATEDDQLVIICDEEKYNEAISLQRRTQ